MSLRAKTVGVTAVGVIAGLVLLSAQTSPPGGDDVDRSKRRGYTLIANTHNNRALLDVHVVSNVRKTILLVDGERRNTPWKYSFWAEPNELIYIDLEVWTHGTHQVGDSIWSRCEIQFNGGMVGGDAEVDNIHVKDRSLKRQQTYAACVIEGG